jgi:alpha-D-ribose 1-methylphosphonate 5-triphosphate synthase subunit PhnG
MPPRDQKMMLALLLLLQAARASSLQLGCGVAFDVAPELRARGSLESWHARARDALQLANRELQMHASSLLFYVAAVRAAEIGVFATAGQTLAAYAAQTPNSTCVHVLLAQRNVGDIIGLAFVDGRCTADRSYAVVFDALSPSFRQTLLHELLHVVGADHTEDDATSVLAPRLSFSLQLPDEPGWTPLANATRQGCETENLDLAPPSRIGWVLFFASVIFAVACSRFRPRPPGRA